MAAKREDIVTDKVYARMVDGKAMFPHAVSIEGKRVICLSGQVAVQLALPLFNFGPF